MSEENKPKTEAEIREMKKKYSRMLGTAVFLANDSGLTLEEVFKGKKK